MKRVAMIAGLMIPGAALAQAQPAAAVGDRFVGPHAGLEAGVHDHHITLVFTDIATGDTRDRTYANAGFGVGAFAGYDLALSRRARLGVELEVNAGGGRGPRADFFNGIRFELRPRYGYGATARLGYVVGRLMPYATLGYAVYEYRLRTGTFVEGAGERNSSYTVGAGAEYRIDRRIGVRLDYKHLDNTLDRWLIGVPIRF